MINILHIVVNFALMVLFLRFMVQWAGLKRNNPFVAPIYRIGAVVDVFSRIFPVVGKKGVNGSFATAALVIMLLVRALWLALKTQDTGDALSLSMLFFATTLGGVVDFLGALRWVMLASVVASLYMVLSERAHPVAEIAMRMAEPIVAPFRRIVPNMGMFDLGFLVAIFALGILREMIMIIAQRILI